MKRTTVLGARPLIGGRRVRVEAVVEVRDSKLGIVEFWVQRKLRLVLPHMPSVPMELVRRTTEDGLRFVRKQV